MTNPWVHWWTDTRPLLEQPTFPRLLVALFLGSCIGAERQWRSDVRRQIREADLRARRQVVRLGVRGVVVLVRVERVRRLVGDLTRHFVVAARVVRIDVGRAHHDARAERTQDDPNPAEVVELQVPCVGEVNVRRIHIVLAKQPARGPPGITLDDQIAIDSDDETTRPRHRPTSS